MIDQPEGNIAGRFAAACHHFTHALFRTSEGIVKTMFRRVLKARFHPEG